MNWKLCDGLNPREKVALYISLFIHIVIAWQSIGYYQSDEHFQILEFANAKLGLSPASDLPWEYSQKIRPTLQPAIVYELGSFFQSIGFYDPFVIAFLLRLITALLSWWATALLIQRVVKQLNSDQHRYYFILIANFLWFLPYFHARFSSETWSGLFFFFGFYIITSLLKNSINWFLKSAFAGALFAISFWCRFQIGFAIIGLGAWILIFKYKRLLYLLPSVLGAGIVALICIKIDHWFYGEVVFTPYQYYTVNITNDVASNWGVSPWWSYFTMFLETAALPVSLVVLVGFILSVYFKPTNEYMWPMLVLIGAHMVVPHKEIRFLAPTIFLLPWCMVLFLTELRGVTLIQKLPHKYFQIGRWLVMIVNIPLLIVVVFFRPAEESTAFYKFVYEKSHHHSIKIISTEGDPYAIGAGLKSNFYKSAKTKVVITTTDKMKEELSNQAPNEITYVYTRHFNLAPEISSQANDFECDFRTLPSFLQHFNFNGWVNRTRVMALFRSN